MKILLSSIALLLLLCNASNNQRAENESSDLNIIYDVQDVLVKTRDGATISAIVVKKKGVTTPQPVILQYTINDKMDLLGEIS